MEDHRNLLPAAPGWYVAKIRVGMEGPNGWPDSLALVEGAFLTSPDSPVVGDWVVELVGLEPTTRVLWNVGVSDQLTRSNTMHSSSNSSGFWAFPQKGN